MLKVKTYVGPSTIEGVGLFAAEFIPAGTLIFQEDEYTQFITREDYNNMSEIQREFIDRYSYFNGGVYKVSMDNDRFTNHSSTPNTIDLGDVTIARLNIREGEEITADYKDLFETNDSLQTFP